MEPIKQLLNIDFDNWLTITFTILVGVSAITIIVSNITKFFGRPLRWFELRDKDHELLMETVQALNNLRQKQENDVAQSIKHDKEIKEDLERLTQLFIDKEIDDMRWEILDFASALSAGRNYSEEQFNHVFYIYSKYEKILEENNLTNGRVVASMEVINEVYKEKLKNGF